MPFLSFDGVTDGAAITAVGTTGADSVVNTSGSMEWDDDMSFSEYQISTTARVLPSSTSGGNYFQRTTGIAHPTLSVVGVFRLDALGVGLPLMWIGTSTSTRAFVLQISTTGQLQVYNASNAVIYQSTGVVTVGTVFRVAAWATWNGGRIRAAVFQGADLTPIANMDSGVLTGQAVGTANYAAIRWGKSLSGTYATPFNMAYLGWDATEAFIDPPNPAPTAEIIEAGPYICLDAGQSTNADTLTLTPSTDVIRIGNLFFVPAPSTPTTYTLAATSAGGTATDTTTVNPVAEAGGVRLYYWDGLTLRG